MKFIELNYIVRSYPTKEGAPESSYEDWSDYSKEPEIFLYPFLTAVSDIRLVEPRLLEAGKTIDEATVHRFSDHPSRYGTEVAESYATILERLLKPTDFP